MEFSVNQNEMKLFKTVWYMYRVSKHIFKVLIVK